MMLPLLFLAALAQASNAQALAPVVSGNANSPACRDAVTLADSAFKSTSTKLYESLVIPKAMTSQLRLGTTEPDLSGGDALEANDVFEKIPLERRSVYWSEPAGKDLRIVVVASDLGWRGDMYDLYLLDPAVERSSFVDRESSGHDWEGEIVSGAWRPPLVFELPDGGGKWFVDVGQPYIALADWVVYTPQSRQPVCKIVFRNPTAPKLPAPVRDLARNLDETLGPGNDEGTLHQTAGLRIHVRDVLGNLAFRPWALTDADAYNSRADVDAGLAAWAGVNRARARVQGQLHTAYAPAAHALARYYERNFGLDRAQAQVMADWATDLLYRSNFVFPRPYSVAPADGLDTNPWAKASTPR